MSQGYLQTANAGNLIDHKVSTDALKGFIVDMHNEGHTDAFIAKRFGYNRAYIQQLRAKMGLEAKWGKNAPRFSAEMDADILRLHDEDELRWAEIGRIIPRPRTACLGNEENKEPLTERQEQQRWCKEIAERYAFLDQRRTEEAEKGPVVVHTKKCLSCRISFETMDRKKEWYCGPCRDRLSSYGQHIGYAGTSNSVNAYLDR